MGTFTYAAVLGFVFLLGVLVFMQFETPLKMFKRGIQALDKGISRIKNIEIIHLGKNTIKTTLTIGGNKGEPGDSFSKTNHMKLYVHEH